MKVILEEYWTPSAREIEPQDKKVRITKDIVKEIKKLQIEWGAN